MIGADHRNSIIPFPLFHGTSSVFLPSAALTVWATYSKCLPTMREKNFFGNAPIARRPNLFDRFVAHPGRVLKPTSSRTILTLP